MRSFGVIVLVSAEISEWAVRLAVRFGGGWGFRLTGSRMRESLRERLSLPSQGYDSQSSQGESIRQAVFNLLDKNPLLTAKPLCKLLNLPYGRYRDYVTHLRSKWKCDYRNERGSKCSSVHGWRGWCFVPAGLDRSVAVAAGWVETKARNRWLLWKDKFGRMQWFETDRVSLYVRKPANLGKAYQLVCNGFSFTGLITDVKVLESVLKNVRFKGAHFVFDTKERLPYLVIDLFKKSNGVVIKVGDRTHPTSIEIIASYMDWAERNEQLLRDILTVFSKPCPPTLKDGRYIS